MIAKQTTRNPIQPTVIDETGVRRFKENAIVRVVLEAASASGVDLNKLACMGFSDDDWQQFAQLIGYSVSGYAELSYVTDDAYGVVQEMIDGGWSESEARIRHVESELHELRLGLRDPMARLFGRHPDDLYEADSAGPS